jgi:DNA-binding NarL/FixJ family response regulator
VSEPLRVLIADDHALLRRGLREVLEESGDIEVVAEAADGEEAVRLAQALYPDRLDLILMDLEMPKLGGIRAIRQLRTELPDLKVIVLTGSIRDQDLYLATTSGAAGFLTKELNPAALVRAIRDHGQTGALAMTGTTAAKAFAFLQRQVEGQQAPMDEATPALESTPPERSAEHLSGEAPLRADAPAALPRLTAREREVLDLLSQGMTDRQIGERLTISLNTAREYAQSAIHKLGASTRAEAVARYRVLFP